MNLDCPECECPNGEHSDYCSHARDTLKPDSDELSEVDELPEDS